MKRSLSLLLLLAALFAAAAERGFDWRSCNGTGLPTRRRPTGDGVLSLHLDWIFSRNAECVRHGMLSTLLTDCGWAAAESAMRPAATIKKIFFI